MRSTNLRLESRRRAPSMTGPLGAALLAAMAGLLSPHRGFADQLAVTVGGTVVTGVDGAGAFGPKGASLVGKPYSVVYTLDFSLGKETKTTDSAGTVTFDSLGDANISGYGATTVAIYPVIAAMTIDGNTVTFGTNRTVGQGPYAEANRSLSSGSVAFNVYTGDNTNSVVSTYGGNVRFNYGGVSAQYGADWHTTFSTTANGDYTCLQMTLTTPTDTVGSEIDSTCTSISVSPVTTALTPTTTTVTVSPTATTAGTAVSVTAMVATASSASIPSGTVTFSSGGTTLGSATLDGAGTATFTTMTLPVGSDPIVASYGGDTTHSSSVSSIVTVTVNPAPTLTTISLSPASIVLGQSATLMWTSTNATNCTAAGAWSGNQALSGTLTVTPSDAGTASYDLTCTGPGGSANAEADLTVSAPVPTVSVSVAPTTVTLGQSATLSWSSTQATSCTASGSWSGAQSTSGSLSVTPGSSGVASYTLACTGTGGTAQSTASLTVTAPTGKGGGGALDMWVLGALALLAILSAQKMRPTEQETWRE